MDTHTDYPAHLYEPKRREIAVHYIRHELRKLFPSLRDVAAWKTIDGDIADWYDGGPLMMPVRDFWNGLHGISMGFRLKNIVSWLTSKNLQWEERAVPVEELWFGSTLDEMRMIGEAPSGLQVKTWFFDPEHSTALEQTRRAHEERSQQTMSRNEFPIIAILKDGVLRVTDGNRRLLRAILNQERTINTVVAEPIDEPVLFESWIPTSTLIDLVSFHSYWLKLGREMTEPTAKIIAELIRDSHAGRIEFMQRAVTTSREDEQLLLAVRARLVESNIVLSKAS